MALFGPDVKFDSPEEKLQTLYEAGGILKYALKKQGLLQDEEDDTNSGSEDSDYELFELRYKAQAQEFWRTRLTADCEFDPPKTTHDYYRLYLNHLDHLITGGRLQKQFADAELNYSAQRDRFVTILLSTDLGAEMLWVFYGVREHWHELVEKLMINQRGMPNG